VPTPLTPNATAFQRHVGAVDASTARPYILIDFPNFVRNAGPSAPSPHVASEHKMSTNPHLSRRALLGMTAAVPLALTIGSGTAHAADSAYAMVYFT
jgi:hypothetical protein